MDEGAVSQAKELGTLETTFCPGAVGIDGGGAAGRAATMFCAGGGGVTGVTSGIGGGGSPPDGFQLLKAH
jgi:hypothetical protein